MPYESFPGDNKVFNLQGNVFANGIVRYKTTQMKKVQLLSLTFLILILGCRKSDSNLLLCESTIIGKWTYTESYYSIGGPGQWHSVTPANQTIEFKPDGSFISANSFLRDAKNFEIVDSVTIKFQPASTATGYILMGYLIKTAERELYLYPVDPVCIEGCSYKFKQ